MLTVAGDDRAVATAAFGSQSPGLMTVPNAVFGSNPPVPAVILAKAFQLNTTTIEWLQQQNWMELSKPQTLGQFKLESTYVVAIDNLANLDFNVNLLLEEGLLFYFRLSPIAQTILKASLDQYLKLIEFEFGEHGTLPTGSLGDAAVNTRELSSPHPLMLVVPHSFDESGEPLRINRKRHRLQGPLTESSLPVAALMSDHLIEARSPLVEPSSHPRESRSQQVEVNSASHPVNASSSCLPHDPVSSIPS
ncbi:hypothetical protein ZIOFF_003922 [Zingiber officinale]|uniref:Cupin type-1 domain-containing protein n=1 Tax=Zingiber officinale TaxID=94328 RepID=A0A8J5IUK2_ZINOF|nr:hypothetical protein ZIOFF_003922 [Zingiber officinale]